MGYGAGWAAKDAHKCTSVSDESSCYSTVTNQLSTGAERRKLWEKTTTPSPNATTTVAANASSNTTTTTTTTKEMSLKKKAAYGTLFGVALTVPVLIMLGVVGYFYMQNKDDDLDDEAGLQVSPPMAGFLGKMMRAKNRG